MVVGGRDVGVLDAHRVEGALPQVTGEGQHVRLVHQGQVAAGAGLGQLEGVAHAPLDPVAGVDRTLGGDLVRCALAQEAALAGVGALGVLADDDEVVGSVGMGEGPLVDVQVEFEAHLEQQAPLDDPRGDVGGTDGTQKQGVECAPLVEHVVGEHGAVAQVAGPAQVVVDGVDGNAGGAHDLEGLGHHLGTDAVSSDHSHPVGHGPSCPFFWFCPVLVRTCCVPACCVLACCRSVCCWSVAGSAR